MVAGRSGELRGSPLPIHRSKAAETEASGLRTTAMQVSQTLRSSKTFAPSCEKIDKPSTPEHFVSAETAANFLSIQRRQLLALARKGLVRGYTLGSGSQRRTWVFRLSDLAQSVVDGDKILAGGPR